MEISASAAARDSPKKKQITHSFKSLISVGVQSNSQLMHFPVASALRDTSSASQWNTRAAATVHCRLVQRRPRPPSRRSPPFIRSKLDYLLSFNSSNLFLPACSLNHCFFFLIKKNVSFEYFFVVESWANYYHRISPFLFSLHYFSLVVRLPPPFFSVSHLIGFIPSGGFQLLLHDLQVNYFILSRSLNGSQWQSTPQTSLAGFSSSNLNECVSQWPTTCSSLPFIRNSSISST
jgi:hypothetical protein